MKTNKFTLSIRLLLVTTILVVLQLSAQDVVDDDTYTLSPFEVSTSSDVGYLAQNTLAGSRLNTDLKDTAAAISVFTPEFIEDIGALSIEEILQYGSNVTDSSSFGQATVNGNSLSEFDAIFYTRGLPSSRARNYFVWEIASDVFNVERVDQSRGPNSILFGVGSPGGIVNASTKQGNLIHSFGKARAVIGSENLVRFEVDMNQILVDGKLAVRVNLMKSDENGWRRFQYKDQSRLHFAAKYRPFEHTEIRAEYEKGEVENIVIRPWGGMDQLSGWLGAGRPILDAVDASKGVGKLGGANYVTFIDNLGYALDMRNTLITRASSGNAGAQILDDGIFNSKTGWEGPAATRDNEYSTYSLFWDQRVFEGLNVQLAFNHQESDFVSYDPQNNSHNVRGNPSETFSDGTGGYGGSYYTEVVWENRNREREIDTFRASLSYEFDFKDWLNSEGAGKWLGRHRLAGLYEDKETSNVRSELRPYLEGAPYNRNPENGRNMVRMRHYVNPGDLEGFQAADWRDLSGYVYTDSSGNSYPVTWYQRNANVDDDIEEQSALMFAMQNYFLNDRLVTTFGYRKDEVDITNRGTKRGDPVATGKNGQFVVDYDNVSTPSFSAITRTFGVVAHITENISIFANKSNNTGLPSLNQNVLPSSSTPEPSQGKGEDYGVYMDLMDGKFYITLSKYKTEAIGLTAFGTRGAVENRNNRVLDALSDAGIISSSEAEDLRVVTNVYTFDHVSEGYEFTLTANPSDNWRISMNYANTELVQTNIANDVVDWFADNRALWDANGDLSTGNLTIAEEVEELENWIASRKQLEGSMAQGSKEHTFRMFTRYDFDEGLLAGFHIGGGARYISGSAIAADANGDVIRGEGQTMFDLVTGYKFEIREGFPVRVQLNINNLLDETDPYFTRAKVSGVVDRYTLPTPRQFRLSASFDF